MKFSKSVNTSRSSRSFERFLLMRYALVFATMALLCGTIIVMAQLSFLASFTLVLGVFLIGLLSFWQTWSGTMDMLKRFGLQLEALGNEEHNTWHLAGYDTGIVADLKQDNQRLTEKMQSSRDAILQQEAVLLAVIEQLSIPVVVIDGHQRVYSANDSFQALLSKNIPELRGVYAVELDLYKREGKWCFSSGSKLANAFRLYENHISRNSLKLDIVLCFSVEQTLRDNEKQVWQKLLRVLNHEVRNSLTPISSIAQSLQEMLAATDVDDRTLELLQVIEKRARYLLDFVEAYSAFKHVQKPNKQYIEPEKLATSLKALNPRVQVAIADTSPIYTDEGHLQQGLINIIKNASEADPDGHIIEVKVEGDSSQHIIRVLDNGCGIQNSDNLFVPFYSTKEDGNGIGLLLSRELMRQQGGDLTLDSRKDTRGAEAIVVLPRH